MLAEPKRPDGGEEDGGGDNAAQAAPTTEIRGQRWIVLTGVVPIDDQMRAFADLASSKSYNPQRDVPIYLGYAPLVSVDEGLARFIAWWRAGQPA